MTSAIYIPTRGRPECAFKAADSAIAATGGRVPVLIVTETSNRSPYLSWPRCRPDNVQVLTIRDHKRGGIGWVRNKIMLHAAAQGHKTVVQMDDDQLVSGDVAGWLRLAARPDVVGIGAWKSMYGLTMGKSAMGRTAKAREAGLFLHRGVFGYQVQALNVANVMKAGNYDAMLPAFEDVELCRAGMQHLGLPWMIYTGVTGINQMSTKDIRATYGGGCGDDGDVRKALHLTLHDRWPAYISSPAGRYRMSWKKMFTERVRAPWPPEDVATVKKFDWRV